MKDPKLQCVHKGCGGKCCDGNCQGCGADFIDAKDIKPDKKAK